MFRKKDRLKAVFVIVAMLLGVIPNTAGAAKWQPPDTPPEYTQIVFQNTGENSDDFSGTFAVDDSDDAEHGKVIKVGNTSSSKLIKTFEK